SNFPTYVSRSVQLASGYTEAMSRPGPQAPILLAVAFLGLMIALAASSVASHRRSLARIVVTTAQLGILLLAFKTAFVRGDEHTPIFFYFGSAAPLLMAREPGSGGLRGMLPDAGRLACSILGVGGLVVTLKPGFHALSDVLLEPARVVTAHVRA